MIVRIMGEGQWRLDESHLAELNTLDSALEASLAGPEDEFRAALTTLLDRVREAGSMLADDELVESDVVLPAPEASEDEVRELLTSEGLLPG